MPNNEYNLTLWHHCIVWLLFGDKHQNLMRHRRDGYEKPVLVQVHVLVQSTFYNVPFSMGCSFLGVLHDVACTFFVQFVAFVYHR